MKLIVLLAFAALATAHVVPPIPILRASSDLSNDGSYKFGFETGHGINVEESGVQKQITRYESGTASRGSYSYRQADGSTISVIWTADENGFQPKGSHLPVAPPTPDHVIQLLKGSHPAAAGQLPSKKSPTC